MKWNIDNSKAIHTQLVEQLKSSIISGDIDPGSKLDSVRIMAQEAEVNPNTMQRALVELENQGLVYSKRTIGRFVTDDKVIIQSLKEELAISCINQFKLKLKTLGYASDEIIKITMENIKNK